MKIFLCYLILINLYAFFLMYFDKTKSEKKKWRVEESKLLLTAFLFGSIGIYAGMYIFKHKTRHKKFTIGIPFIILLQIYILTKII